MQNRGKVEAKTGATNLETEITASLFVLHPSEAKLRAPSAPTRKLKVLF